MLEFVALYLRTVRRPLTSEQTFVYGSSLVKFVAREDAVLEAWDYDWRNRIYVAGATRAVARWRAQLLICARLDVDGDPPSPYEFVAVSPGVLEGESVRGVRYEPDGEMTGWWLFASSFGGDMGSMRKKHLAHLLEHGREDVVQYLALPHGFRFDLGADPDVYTDAWFDPEVAASLQEP